MVSVPFLHEKFKVPISLIHFTKAHGSYSDRTFPIAFHHCYQEPLDIFAVDIFNYSIIIYILSSTTDNEDDEKIHKIFAKDD